MKLFRVLVLASCLLLLLAVSTPANAASLSSRVNEAFRSVFGRNPSIQENLYWLGRISPKDKSTYESLRGAMMYYKGINKTMASQSATSGAVPSAGKLPVKASDNKNDLIKNVLPLFVNIFSNDPSNAEKAWWRKRISCGEIKTHKALVASMSYHKSKKSRKGSDAICGSGISGAPSAAGVSKKQIAGISTHPYGDQVRIGIFNTDGSPIVVTADMSFQIREGLLNIVATLGKDDEVQVSWSNGTYHVRGSGIELDSDTPIRIVPLDMGIVRLKNYADKSTTIADKNYNRFRGVIEIQKSRTKNELWAINELRAEYYLRGLAETSGDGPEEYIKALGIAARTYVFFHKIITGGRRTDVDFDIGRTADDQIYRGYEYEIITPRMSSIFNGTKGIIVTDGEGDKPVQTVYFSDSDGRTRSAKEVWGTDKYPHLQQSVEDPYHVASECKGHCVGMSAQGAYGFASKEGWSYQKILNYFYKGIKIVKAY